MSLSERALRNNHPAGSVGVLNKDRRVKILKIKPIIRNSRKIFQRALRHAAGLRASSSETRAAKQKRDMTPLTTEKTIRPTCR